MRQPRKRLQLLPLQALGFLLLDGSHPGTGLRATSMATTTITYDIDLGEPPTGLPENWPAG